MPSQRHVIIGHLEFGVERTLRLKGIHTTRTVAWGSLPSEAEDLYSMCVSACLVIPGEADAGGVMSTTALGCQANVGRFSLARCLMDFEPQLEELWQLFLGGAMVCLFVCGLRDCGSLFRRRTVLVDFHWSASCIADRCYCLHSDGLDLNLFLLLFHCN